MTTKCFSITSAYSCNLKDSFKLNWRAPCKIIIVLTHKYFLRGNQIVMLILTPLQYWWCLFEWWTWLYTKINIFLVDKSHVLQVKETFLLLVFTYYSIITTTQNLADCKTYTWVIVVPRFFRVLLILCLSTSEGHHRDSLKLTENFFYCGFI